MPLQIGVRKKVLQARYENRCTSGADIARQTGVSRQRVAQILKEKNSRPLRSYLCNNYGQVIPGHKKALFCSYKCYREYHHVPVSCSGCGSIFWLTQSALFARLRNHKHEGIYCSKECYGRYAGANYGWGATATYGEKERTTIRWLRHLNFTQHEIAVYSGVGIWYVKKILMEMGVYEFREGNYGLHATLGRKYPNRKRGERKPYLHPGRQVRKAHIRVSWLRHLNFTDDEIIRWTGCGKATIQRVRESERA